MVRKDGKSTAIATTLAVALTMSTDEFKALGLRKQSTAASDAEAVDTELIDMAVAVSKRPEMVGPKGEEFNVGKLSKICHKIDPTTFPTLPSAHSKLMSVARWLVNNRNYTMPVKQGAERTTIAYPPAPATT